MKCELDSSELIFNNHSCSNSNAPSTNLIGNYITNTLNVEVSTFEKTKNARIMVNEKIITDVLIGSEFQIPKSEWHKIQINHLEKIEYIYYQQKLLPNINREYFLGKIFR